MFHILVEITKENTLNKMIPMLIEKVAELRNKLNDAEFRNEEKSQKIVSLTRQLGNVTTEAIKAKLTSNPILPGIPGPLGRLNSHPDALTPGLKISQGRKGGMFDANSIYICHVFIFMFLFYFILFHLFIYLFPCFLKSCRTSKQAE